MLILKKHPDLLECGTDEAGRGCLAGPVTAAAVLLPDDFKNPLLNDSKKLTEKNRNILRKIIEKEAISFQVTHVFMDEIQKLNILHASIAAMQRSILQLRPTPEFILVDGNKFTPVTNIPHECIVKGDGKYVNIAAASVLAKTYRDEYMQKIDMEFPMYGWKKNKGYPTKTHRDAIRTHGATKYHRMGFKLLPEQYTLPL
ncbi:ribonuclease HII [Aquimarina agarilytica]|uniref:ribonuclease HII n=1 Tax=Aquimarina agarilytica TaxID=1087449 RepID=UPI0002880622|nr:ribonuclease HII [Aquimarina agarilytica]